MIDATQINEWKMLLLGNSQRIQEEHDVIERFGRMFHPSSLDQLSKEDFKSFLLMKNNRHWEGIHRQSNMITADMEKLRQALKMLLDESQPIEERLDFLFPKNKPGFIKGLGRAIVTPVLMMVYPKKYGVYNNKSEEGLEKIGLLPNLKKKSFAEKYVAVNEVLNQMAEEYGLTLWQVDEVVGWLATGNAPIESLEDDLIRPATPIGEEPIQDYADFGLEAHLEEFLVANWDKLDLSKDYTILTKDGDIVGQQYVTPVGRIDLLCRHNNQKDWLVIELKKGRSSDAVTGQILRYMGWIEENLAQEGEKVEGIIILGDIDDKLRYSVKTLPKVSLSTYMVSFQLNSHS